MGGNYTGHACVALGFMAGSTIIDQALACHSSLHRVPANV